MALSPGYRATAEDRGVEVIEGARARRCRVAVDGEIFEAAFPQVRLLVGTADLHRWRGQLDYWVFLDGEVGQVAGSINGEATAVVPEAIQGTVEVLLTATERGRRPGRLSSCQMTLDDEREPYAAKRDRLARMTRLVSILQAHPDGVRTADVAERVGMSVRTVYRDLRAIDEEIGVPVWADGGRWGIDQEKAFLPPLKLTQSEAMAVVLSARLMVRYADKYDPDLASAFEKLEQGLPPALAEHVERTLDVLSKAPRDERFIANVRLLTKAWAERRVVHHRLRAGALRPRRGAPRGRPSGPYLLEPSLQTHALYLMGFDEERAGAPDVQDRADPDGRADPADLRATRSGGDDQSPCGRPGTSSPTRSPWRSCSGSRPGGRAASSRRPGTRPRRSPTEPDGSLRWSATVSGTIEIRLWILSWGDDVEVLAPPSLRDDVGRDASTRGRPLRGLRS